MLNNFKKHWEITSNWQLIIPLMGIIGLFYSSYKLVRIFSIESLAFNIALSLVVSIILLKFTLFLFKKLEKKWKLTYRWEMIRVFIVFAITGSSSAIVGKPFLKMVGITSNNLQPVIYWLLYVLISFIFYQVLLISIAWLFGQFQFFWDFEKKMIRRMRLGFLLNKKQ
ncbi:MAG: hypothetical protein P8P27_01545 [Flavobacteriaceae bacterium]|nr:hypothetical protein [Flavobacteriaceae bacterium]